MLIGDYLFAFVPWLEISLVIFRHILKRRHLILTVIGSVWSMFSVEFLVLVAIEVAVGVVTSSHASQPS